MTTPCKKIYAAIESAMQSLTADDRRVGKASNFTEPLPSIARLKEIVHLCREITFPGFFMEHTANNFGQEYNMGVNIEQLAHKLRKEIFAGICLLKNAELKFDKEISAEKSEQITADFIMWLPELRRLMRGDVTAMYNGDPAATSEAEIIFAYPAIRAISSYRIAHRLLELGVPLIPRVITEMAHGETGVDINPQAEIGERFAIDHCTGVVVGATCIIGDDVKLYQGVTLGAKSFPLDEKGNPVKGIPRHPIIGNNVIIYAQATILGRVTIGDNSIIGGNVWLTHSVEPGSHITQKNCE